jgi:prepilin-type N-terminal cleavage/methylation domain-containing protein
MGRFSLRVVPVFRDEGGFTLIESLMAAALLAIVLGAVLSLGETAARIVPLDTERNAVIGESQVGLYQMTRELRGASSGTCGSAIAVAAYTFSGCVVSGGTAQRVTYDCSVATPGHAGWTRCVRTKSGQTRVVVDRLLNVARGQPVFTCTPDCSSPTFVQAGIQVPAAGDLRVGHTSTIYYNDGFALRNNGAGA